MDTQQPNTRDGIEDLPTNDVRDERAAEVRGGLMALLLPFKQPVVTDNKDPDRLTTQSG